jgi:hypothetical protein
MNILILILKSIAFIILFVCGASIFADTNVTLWADVFMKILGGSMVFASFLVWVE